MTLSREDIERVAMATVDEVSRRINQQIPESALPGPYAIKYRIRLRRMPTEKLEEVYTALKLGKPTGIEMVGRNEALLLSAIREVLWERGRLKEIEE